MKVTCIIYSFVIDHYLDIATQSMRDKVHEYFPLKMFLFMLRSQ
jgi:hypothetical protein